MTGTNEPPSDTIHTAKSPLVLGIDLGGTKSAATLLTPTGEILYRTVQPTPAQAGPNAIVPLLVRLARKALTNVPVGSTVGGVGVSAGAPADAQTGRVFEAPNLPGWDMDGVPLADLISDALGLPVALENDADATALAEYRFGAGQGCGTMAFLTVGTGIGAGLILNGHLHRGDWGAGGEVGHIAVDPSPDGVLCTCGLRGCLEAYSSGPSLVRHAIRGGWTGESTGQAIFEGAARRNRSAKRAVVQAGVMLGRGIATLVMLLNPRRVVLGTLAVHGGDLLLPIVRQEVMVRTWPRLHTGLEIVPAALGDRAQDLAALCAWLARVESTANGL